MQLIGEQQVKIGWKVAGADESVAFGKPFPYPKFSSTVGPKLDMLGGPWQQRRRGGDFGPNKLKGETVKTSRNWLQENDPGDFVVFRGASKTRNLIAKNIMLTPKIIDTDGTEPVDVMHTLLYTIIFKDKLSSMGICSCRDIAGTSSWSQHAYCNAEDIHGSSSTMQNVFDYLVANADKLSVANCIYNRRIWNKAGGNHYYDGSNPHYDHCHVDFNPQGSGTPPCAQ
jgi:hypothetical protein